MQKQTQQFQININELKEQQKHKHT